MSHLALRTMSKRQADVLNFLRAYQDEHGFAPSLREIATGIGLRSASGVHRIIHAMQERNVLRRSGDSHLRLYEYNSTVSSATAEAFLRLLLNHIDDFGHITKSDPVVGSIRKHLEQANERG